MEVSSGCRGVVQRGLSDGRVMTDARRVVALFSVMATSTAGMARTMWISSLKMDLAVDGGDGFCSVCMRCSLRVS
jgi:hypothetical protein